ncbi:hypothetical protein Tco_0271078 [Tanacetum coccineum]
MAASYSCPKDSLAFLVSFRDCSSEKQNLTFPFLFSVWYLSARFCIGRLIEYGWSDLQPEAYNRVKHAAKRILEDPIEIEWHFVHPTPVDVFPAVTMVRTLAQHGEAIRGHPWALAMDRRKARMEVGDQLTSVQEHLRQDQVTFRKLQEFCDSQLGRFTIDTLF